MTEKSRRRDAVREAGSLSPASVARDGLEAPPGGSPLKFTPEPTGEIAGNRQRAMGEGSITDNTHMWA
jgi:hypothetical protein